MYPNKKNSNLTHRPTHKRGFTAVELLITLFVAAAFLSSGYVLYNAIVHASGEARKQAMASNIAYNYLRKYSTNVAVPCIASTPVSSQTPTGATGSFTKSKITVSITCPQASIPSLSRIQSTITYGNGNQVTHAINATQ